MDKDGLPYPLKVVDEDMVHHSILEIGGEDLPDFRLFYSEENGTRRVVGPIFQFSFKLEQVLRGVELKPQGVDGVALILPAFQVCPVDVLEREYA